MPPSADGPEDGPSVNLEEMAAYMMADLGRGRQEELPLDDRVKGNYRYNPDRRRGGHVRVSNALRNKLAGGWGNPIKDAEAEQIDGLVVEEAPWRRGVERITRATARPLPAVPTKVLRDNTVTMVVPSVTVPTPATPSPAPPAPAVPAPVTPAVESTFAQVLEHARAECSFRFNSMPPEWESIVVYYGVLLVRPGPTKFIKASFEMVMFNEPEKPVSARLTLKSDGLPSREHDLSNLNAPHMDEDKKCCILAGSGPVAKHSYYVQLQDNAQTKEFSDSLFGLQRVIHESRTQQSSGTPEPTSCSEPIVAVEAPAPVSSTPDLVELDHSEQAPMDIEAVMEAVCGFDLITDALATKYLNPESFKVLDSICEEWYKMKYPKMNATSLLGLISSLQDVFKRHIGVKQHERVCEPGPKPVYVPESVKDFSGPITYTSSELEALRGKGRLPELDEETMSPQDAKMVWKQGLADSRWSS